MSVRRRDRREIKKRMMGWLMIMGQNNKMRILATKEQRNDEDDDNSTKQ